MSPLAIRLLCAFPLLLLACSGSQPSPPPGEAAIVPPSPPASAEPIVSASPVVAPAPSAVPAVVASAAPSSAPSASGLVDRTTCRPRPPAVTFEVKDDDVVIPLDATGCPLGESHFVANGYSYKAAVDFVTELQKQLKAGDKKALSELVRYPLRVNGAKGAVLVIKDKGAFLKSFDRIYSASVSAAVLKADPRDVSASSKGIMLGDGILWSDGEKGRYGITAINTP